MPKPDARKLSPEAQEDLRRRVVAAVNGGMGITDAARAFQVTRQSIHNWMNAVQDGGTRALKARKRGPKQGTTLLDASQASALVRAITTDCPDQLRLPFALWTREAVGALAQRFGVTLSLSTIGRYLRDWGMTPQKPVRRAYERDEASVRAWLKKEYPAIRDRAKREKAEIHWGDEMGLRSDHQTGTSYSPKGQTPVIPGTGQRFSCNMISTVTNRGSLAFMVFTERFTAPVMIRFLKRLTRHVGGAGRKVVLIVDGHPVHKSRMVRQWVQDNAARIELFLLPSYSPDFNPDEFLNNDVKSNALGRRRPADRSEMITGVRSYLRSTQRQPELVKRYFHADSVRYAA